VTPAAPAVAQSPLATAAPAPAPRERSISRFTARDYSYVRRELVRIAILAVGIFVLIVVLSFFLP
jgi:hypothetical protein